MNSTDRVEIRFLDKDGYEAYGSLDHFDTMKSARDLFHEIKDDRRYFVERAESEYLPKTLATIQLIKNGEVVLDHFPDFK